MRFLSIIVLCLMATTARGQEAAGPADPYLDYATLLTRYVEDGAVDYARLLEDDPMEWHRFLGWLAEAQPEMMTVDQQRAFWINAYNARAIAGVLQRYPLDSVEDVGFVGGRVRGFFSRREHAVAGRPRSLDEIQKEILLKPPLWDARIHWALTCAAVSCPRLRSEPYEHRSLDMQLDFQARTYLNGPTGHRIDPGAQTLYLSRILDWGGDDFRRAAGSVRDYVAEYLTGESAAMALQDEYRIEYLDYDWDLNDAF